MMQRFKQMLADVEYQRARLLAENTALKREVAKLEHEMSKSVYAERWREYKHTLEVLRGRKFVGWLCGGELKAQIFHRPAPDDRAVFTLPGDGIG